MFGQLFGLTLIIIMVLCAAGQAIYSLSQRKHKDEKEENDG